MTVDEYFQTPETLVPQELVFGRVRVADAPFVSHQRVVLAMALALHEHVEATGAGELLVAPLDVVLDEERALVVQPDLLFVARERAHIVTDRVYGPPDLVVEVLSPRPRIGEWRERLEWFAQYGVREVWLYHQPARQLRVLALEQGAVVSTAVLGWDDRIASRVLPSMSRSVSSLIGRY